MLAKGFLSKIVPPLMLILLFALVVYRLKPVSVPKTPASETSEKGVALVEAVRLVKGDLESLFPALRRIEPRQRVNVSSLVTGRLDKVLVNIGDKVQAGDVLAVIDSKVEAELKEVEAELELVKATLIKTQEQTNRDSSQDNLLKEIRIKRLMVKVDQLRQNLNVYTLRAPISGIIVTKCCAPGDTVAALDRVTPSEPLFVIEDIESVYAQATIPEKFISQIQVGMKAKVRVGAYPPEHFPLAIFQSQLVHINPTVNPRNRTIGIQVEIPNGDGKLRSGMSSEVAVVIAQYKNALLVPKEAVVKGEFRGGSATIVYVIEDQEAFTQGKTSRVLARRVNLGLDDGVNYLVDETGRAGAQEREMIWAQEGDLVATVGSSGLVSGQLVRALR